MVQFSHAQKENTYVEMPVIVLPFSAIGWHNPEAVFTVRKNRDEMIEIK
jgi:hypothetical protein